MLSRRQMLQKTTCGFGYLAFAALSTEAAAAETRNSMTPRVPHFPGRAKQVIFLAMRGAPSQMDLLDYKPKLQTVRDKESLVRGRKFVASPWRFRQHGQGGLWISELLPNLAGHADSLCVIKSMKTDDQSHTGAFVQLHTGSARAVRPSLGAWLLYGLGTENANLPGYITISPSIQFGGPQNYGSAFLPAVYQGTPIRDVQRPNGGMDNIVNRNLAPEAQRHQLDLIQALNRSAAERNPENTQLDGVIQSYELAFRMQAELPRVMDIARETKATQQMYGVGDPATDRFGRQCLLARRLIEEGVRFVELMDEDWDQHLNLAENLPRRCRAVDKPIAGLLTDLKQRGLLEDTLVIWGGEFGRTPDNEQPNGRNHNSTGFTIWMAGGGVKGGIEHGETDEFGYKAVANEVHIHDLHATILALLGLDHAKLTFRHAGRDFRLTDVHGRVVKDILA